MKVALVHDWLTGMRGGEHCLEAFLSLYPDADIYTLVHVPGSTSPSIDKRVKGTSFLQRIPGIGKHYRIFLPLYPLAVNSIHVEDYDLVISLSHAAVKNVSVPEGVPHICYCFTPMRYIWDQARHYFGKSTALIQPALTMLRAWDKRQSDRVTQFVAISKFIAARIRCFYNRDSAVIYPPVDSSWIKPTDGSSGKAFLYAGALVPYKRPDLVVEAFNKLEQPLWIAGQGSEEDRLKRKARKNIHFLGKLPDAELAKYFKDCKALIFPGKEDFGMIPVECMAAGRPVIGAFTGALRESVNGITPWKGSSINASEASGVFFRSGGVYDDRQELISTVKYFLDREAQFSPEACINQAKLFSPNRFYSEWNSLVNSLGLESSTPIDRQRINA